MTTVDDLLSAARARLDQVGPTGGRARGGGRTARRHPPAVAARRRGLAAGALLIERNHLEWRLDPASDARIPQATDHDVTWIVLCSEGYSSSLAAASLQDLGLRNATDLDGGFRAWKAAGLPVGDVAAACAPLLAQAPNTAVIISLIFPVVSAIAVPVVAAAPTMLSTTLQRLRTRAGKGCHCRPRRGSCEASPRSPAVLGVLPAATSWSCTSRSVALRSPRVGGGPAFIDPVTVLLLPADMAVAPVNFPPEMLTLLLVTSRCSSSSTVTVCPRRCLRRCRRRP